MLKLKRSSVLKRKSSRASPQLLHEGERAYGATYYNAVARFYHGVDNPPGPMESTGPDLSNDNRLIERHVRRLTRNTPLDVVLTDLLERYTLR